mgnify:CR=1 FL=1
MLLAASSINEIGNLLHSRKSCRVCVWMAMLDPAAAAEKKKECYQTARHSVCDIILLLHSFYPFTRDLLHKRATTVYEWMQQQHQKKRA